MQDIIDEILRGESKTLEFKEQMPANQSIVKTVIAFANTSGGKLIIGVNDDREIVGITDDIFELQDKISSIIYESCYPALLPHMYTKNIEGKILLVIDVNRGSLVPYYVKSEGKENGVYIRIGATNRKADRESILELERQRTNILTWSSFFVTLLRLFYAVYLFSNGVSPFNEECGLLEL